MLTCWTSHVFALPATAWASALWPLEEGSHCSQAPIISLVALACQLREASRSLLHPKSLDYSCDAFLLRDGKCRTRFSFTFRHLSSCHVHSLELLWQQHVCNDLAQSNRDLRQASSAKRPIQGLLRPSTTCTTPYRYMRASIGGRMTTYA